VIRMPYSVDNPQDKIKGLRKHAQTIWESAFNSAYKQYNQDESKSNAVAWSAVEKSGYKKGADGKWSSDSKRGKKMKNMAKFVKWSTKYKNSLPDSSFAVVMGEGDSKVRKLPFKDAEGKVDVPHLRNALVRVSQGKTSLSPAMRSTAMNTLKSMAKKYLKSYQTTKSGEIMKKAMSKFKEDSKASLSAVIGRLREKAANKNPKDEVVFRVKDIARIIEDLESIEIGEDEEEVEEEEKEEEKATPETPAAAPEPTAPPADKTPAEKKKEDKPEEKKDEKKDEEGIEEEETSKFRELMKVCEGYKEELDKTSKEVAKLQDELVAVKKEKDSLENDISKFKEEKHIQLIDAAVRKVSKFKGLGKTEELKLKEHYLTSKMSDTALEEVGRTIDESMFSKMSEPRPTTLPSAHLSPANVNEDEPEFSKLSKDDQLDVLAKTNAKLQGFVFE